MDILQPGETVQEGEVVVRLLPDDLISLTYGPRRLAHLLDAISEDLQMHEGSEDDEARSKVQRDMLAIANKLRPFLPLDMQHNHSLGFQRAQDLAFSEPEAKPVQETTVATAAGDAWNQNSAQSSS